jgi:hypothetical protein
MAHLTEPQGSPPHLTEEELLSRLADCPESGSIWRHFKGALVRVVVCSLDEATLQPLVTYRHEGEAGGPPPPSQVVFTRPLARFLGTVEYEGREVWRFTRVPG